MTLMHDDALYSFSSEEDVTSQNHKVSTNVTKQQKIFKFTFLRVNAARTISIPAYN